MTPMFSIFTLAIKFDCLFLIIFQSFHLHVSFVFDKLASPLWIHVSKDGLNHYLVHSSAQNSLKSAKNVVFFSFCILVDIPMGAVALWLRYWECSKPRTKDTTHKCFPKNRLSAKTTRIFAKIQASSTKKQKVFIKFLRGFWRAPRRKTNMVMTSAVAIANKLRGL